LPWAATAAANFLAGDGEMQALLVGSGFDVSSFQDVSDTPLPDPRPGSPEATVQAPLSLSVYVDNLAEKADNATRSVRERQIRLVRAVCLAQ
jgi:hypothetical protein